MDSIPDDAIESPPFPDRNDDAERDEQQADAIAAVLGFEVDAADAPDPEPTRRADPLRRRPIPRAACASADGPAGLRAAARAGGFFAPTLARDPPDLAAGRAPDGTGRVERVAMALGYATASPFTRVTRTVCSLRVGPDRGASRPDLPRLPLRATPVEGPAVARATRCQQSALLPGSNT